MLRKLLKNRAESARVRPVHHGRNAEASLQHYFLPFLSVAHFAETRILSEEHLFRPITPHINTAQTDLIPRTTPIRPQNSLPAER